MTDREPRTLNFQMGTYPKVLSLLPDDKNTRVLDVGAGEGYFTKMLKDAGYRASHETFAPTPADLRTSAGGSKVGRRTWNKPAARGIGNGTKGKVPHTTDLRSSVGETSLHMAPAL